MSILNRATRALWSRRRRALLSAFIALTLGYAGVHAAVTLAVSPTDRWVALPDGRMLAYRVVNAADNPTARVLLVHGAPADASSWNRFLDSHAHEFPDIEFVAVDRLGYGSSTAGAETSLQAHARSLEPLLSARTIVVGHSYGGPVALRTAALFPDRVAGLVLVAGATDPDMNDAQGFRRAVDAVTPLVPDDWTTANLELLALTDENRAMAPLLVNVSCPVVVLHGRWDPVCPHDDTVGHLRASLPGTPTVKVVSLSRAGHNLHLHHHKRVAEGIRSLTSHRPTTTPQIDE